MTIEQLRREQWENRNWTAVQDRLRAEQPTYDALKRIDTINRMRRSADLRNR